MGPTRWRIETPQPLIASELVKACGFPTLVAQCLVNRKIATLDDATRFLAPRLRNLADPYLIPGMSGAVDRLFTARATGEKMVIFGDYDVDGVTATVLLLQVLGHFGWDLEYYVPSRFQEGYGLNQVAIEACVGRFPCRIILAVDCGSTACASVAWLKSRNIDTVVVDHHQVSNPAPDAVALVNPRAASGENSEAGRELCSVGLAFKLAHAIVKRGRESGDPRFLEYDLRPLLDLVALGTIADLVPLVGENRILVTHGLERLACTARPGLQALARVAQCEPPMSTYQVGFQLAPRLNAAGRLETAEDSIQLLLESEPGRAETLAHSLDQQNRERRAIEKQMADEAIAAVRAQFNPERDFVIVEGRLLWHVGVVGIVASRVSREFHRPTLILGGDNSEWRGSGRSVPGFDLASALRDCDDLLLRHGGHAMAAGVSLHPDRVGAFRERLNTVARTRISPEMLVPELRLDAVVVLNELSIDVVEQLEGLSPFGLENPEVRVVVRGVQLARPPQRFGSERRHLRLWLTDGTGAAAAVWWGAGERSIPDGKLDIAVAPAVNEFDGRRTVQLKVLDLRGTGGE